MFAVERVVAAVGQRPAVRAHPRHTLTYIHDASTYLWGAAHVNEEGERINTLVSLLCVRRMCLTVSRVAVVACLWVRACSDGGVEFEEEEGECNAEEDNHMR